MMIEVDIRVEKRTQAFRKENGSYGGRPFWLVKAIIGNECHYSPFGEEEKATQFAQELESAIKSEINDVLISRCFSCGPADY